MKPNPGNIFFYLSTKRFRTNSPHLKRSTTTSKRPPPKLQQRTRKHLVTKWVALSPLLRQSSLHCSMGASRELSLGSVLFPGL